VNRDDRSPTITLGERALIVTTLVLGASAFLPVLDGSANNLDPSARDSLTEHLWWGVYAAFAVSIVLTRAHRQLQRVLPEVPLLVALIGWAVLSVVWSVAPGVTERRSVALLLTTAVALHLARRLSRREFVDLLAVALAIMVLASAALALLAPHYGLDHLRGNGWRGVLSTKNGLGRIACLAAVVWLYRLRAYGSRPLLGWSVVAVSLLDIYASHSRTSLAVAMLMLLLIAVAPALQGDFRVATAAAMLLICAVGAVAAWLLLHTEVVLSSVGSSTTLTGRTSIWRAAWYMAHHHYWIGYGYNAFWTGIDGPSGVLWGIVGSNPPHAHNGFLDTWLDLGAVGVGLLACFLISSLFRAWLFMRAGGPAELWPLIFLVYLLAFNLSESSFLTRNSIFWMMFVVAAAWTGRPLERELSSANVGAEFTLAADGLHGVRARL
jgi:O-antigen ligase